MGFNHGISDRMMIVMMRILPQRPEKKKNRKRGKQSPGNRDPSLKGR